MKHRWCSFFLKIVTIATMLSSLVGIIASQTAYAGACDTHDGQGAFSICTVTSGTVTVKTPTLSCSLVSSNGGGFIDIMQGCNGSNWEKIGFSNYTGLQQWVLRYGWTYVGGRECFFCMSLIVHSTNPSTEAARPYGIQIALKQ